MVDRKEVNSKSSRRQGCLGDAGKWSEYGMPAENDIAKNYAAKSVKRSGRGMTILEVTLAIALLGIVMIAVYSAFGFAGNMAKREQQRLGAAELANALIVQYLDEKESLPKQQPVDYGPWKFRFHLREDRIGFVEARPPAGTTTRTVSMDRLKQVTITVWLSDETEGGSFDPDSGVPQVALTRVVDPLALRNPDSFANMMATDAGRRSMGEQLSGPGGGAGTTTTGNGSSGRTATTQRTPKVPSKSTTEALPGKDSKK
jgi:type II secretory pathway pseudopilin PulG